MRQGSLYGVWMVLTLTVLSTGCARMTTEEAGTATGAVVGGAVGSEVGGAAATIGGAAAGAVVGKEAGEKLEEDDAGLF